MSEGWNIWEITSYFLCLLFPYVLPSSLFPSVLICSLIFFSFLYSSAPVSFQSVPSLLSSPNFLISSFLSSFLSTCISLFLSSFFFPLVSPSIFVSFKSFLSFLFLSFPLPSFFFGLLQSLLLLNFSLCFVFPSFPPSLPFIRLLFPVLISFLLSRSLFVIIFQK